MWPDSLLGVVPQQTDSRLSETKTCVPTDAKLQLLVGSMFQFERHGEVEQGEAEIANFDDVSRAVVNRHSAHHHVCVADCLHLGQN